MELASAISIPTFINSLPPSGYKNMLKNDFYRNKNVDFVRFSKMILSHQFGDDIAKQYRDLVRSHMEFEGEC